MNTFSYIIVDDSQQGALDTRAVASSFHNLSYVGSASEFDAAVDLVLEKQPALIFLEIDPENHSSGLSLTLISELHRYMINIPKVIITTKSNDFALRALHYGVFDYMLKPLKVSEFRKMLMKLDKGNPPVINLPIITHIPPVPTAKVNPQIIMDPAVKEDEVPEPEDEVTIQSDAEIPSAENVAASDQPESQPEGTQEKRPLVICIKSYGDYRFLNADDIAYLQADNNSTDIHLFNGDTVTAFKTLKHFENLLSHPFLRVHNSYIVNTDYVSRVHTGNSVCYLKPSGARIPFSKSYKENVEGMIKGISGGNYLEV